MRTMHADRVACIIPRLGPSFQARRWSFGVLDNMKVTPDKARHWPEDHDASVFRFRGQLPAASAKTGLIFSRFHGMTW
jgi:hypothetical protein